MTFVAPSSRLVGSRINRKEDPRLLTGRGRYVDDVVVPGMLHVAFARSDIARGRIVSIHTAAAAAVPGVVAVLTAADVNHLLAGPIAATPTLGMGSPGPHKVLADDEVRYVGDPYALVVADSRARAEDAVDLVEMDVAPLTPVVDYTTALESPERVHPHLESNRAGGMPLPIDDELGAIRPASGVVPDDAVDVRLDVLAALAQLRGRLRRRQDQEPPGGHARGDQFPRGVGIDNPKVGGPRRLLLIAVESDLLHDVGHHARGAEARDADALRAQVNSQRL
jgi:hypothetical protein